MTDHFPASRQCLGLYVWYTTHHMVSKPESATERFVRDLMPYNTEEEIAVAIENFQEYLLLVKEMCDRLEEEGISIPKFADEEKPVECPYTCYGCCPGAELFGMP